MMRERAVHFENGRGEPLTGVLHAPDESAPAATHGVVWLSAGQKIRQGAWRMNVEIARSLAARGVPVLRFDFSGIGDSGGDHRHGDAVMDFYGFIQSGGYADEAVLGARLLQEQTGVERVVFGGLCGGAITGLFAASRLKGVVAGHCLIDLPVTISSSARQRYLETHADELLRSRPGETDTVLMLYLKKLADLEAWRRLVRGESDYKLIKEMARIKSRTFAERLLAQSPAALKGPLEAVIARVAPAPPTAGGVDGAPSAATITGADVGVDPSVAAAMQASGEVKNQQVAAIFAEALAAGQTVRFLNSSAYHPTFMGYFGLGLFGERFDAAGWAKRGVKLSVAEDTNHIFSIDSAQAALFDAVDESLVMAGVRLPPRAR